MIPSLLNITGQDNLTIVQRVYSGNQKFFSTRNSNSCKRNRHQREFSAFAYNQQACEQESLLRENFESTQVGQKRSRLEFTFKEQSPKKAKFGRKYADNECTLINRRDQSLAEEPRRRNISSSTNQYRENTILKQKHQLPTTNAPNIYPPMALNTTFRIHSQNRIRVRPVFKDLTQIFIREYCLISWHPVQIRYQSIYTSPLVQEQGKLEISENFLNCHQVSSYFRSKMIDWMLTVFHSFKKSSPQTVLLSVSLLDRFFKSCQENGKILTLQDLHLYGLTMILISSKIEDFDPISLSQLVSEAGHDKFSPSKILKAEMDVLHSLKFQLYQINPSEKACFLLQNFLLTKMAHYDLSKPELDEIFAYLEFIAQALMYKISFVLLPLELLATCIVIVGLELKFQMEQNKARCKNCQEACQGPVATGNKKLQAYQKIINDFSKTTKAFQPFQDAIVIRMMKFLLEVQSEQYKFKAMLQSYPQYKIENPESYNSVPLYQLPLIKCKLQLCKE